MDSLTLVATSTFGLEAVVARELTALGYTEQTVQDGRVVFTADPRAIPRTNLWLRSADRVLIQMASFEATDFDVLFETTKALPWEQWLSVDSKFPVTGKSVRSKLQNTPTCQKIVKKAIAERLKSVYNRHWFEETGQEYKIDISLAKDRATLSIDTSGPGLHKRGYRDKGGPAPLKETLAAALIQLTFWKPGRPFVDPFCGTGTLPIEAAMIGCNLAPGLNRSFDSETWPQIPRGLWQEARAEARDLRRSSIPLSAVGSDIDPKMVKAATHNARMAGVGANVQFFHRDFADVELQLDYGCIVCNPPYGERLSDKPTVDELYREMGRRLGPLETWSKYVLTPQSNFERLFGRPADRRRKLYNGRIECTYYQYHGRRPPGEADPTDAAEL